MYGLIVDWEEGPIVILLTRSLRVSRADIVIIGAYHL